MKKITQLFFLLLFGLQLNAFNDGMVLDSTCSVNILVDSTGAGLLLTADADGNAPFTYMWSTGELTQSISVTPNNAQTYCVTVTDVDGCEASNCVTLVTPPACGATISTSPIGGLSVNAWGTAPYTYLWSTGETTLEIFPNASGNYCVTVTDASGCEAFDCYWYGGGTMDSCSVYIVIDSSQAANLVTLTAIPDGEAPFTYQWNVQNWQTPSIEVPPNGEYCVTITAADGCVASSCIEFNANNCNVTIYEGDSLGITILDAIVTPFGATTYLWSTGETTQYIEPTSAGTYCVTIATGNTGASCTATDCYVYDPFAGSQIQGLVYLPDSNNAVVWDGYAELFEIDNSGTLELVATVDLDSDPAGFFNHYDFGIIADGDYLVRVSIDPNDPIFPDYLPTYHWNTVLWNEADVINVPVNQLYHNVIMDDGQMLTGPGTIDGLVTEGDGLKGGDDQRGPGDPMEGVSVLLFDQAEESITSALTNVDGEYTFGDLPYGTYKIMVEIPGLEQTDRWVTLSADEPSANGVDFEVTETGIVNGIAELVTEQDFTIFPNPASNLVTLRVNASGNFEAQLSMTTLTGATIFAKPTNIVKGVQQIELNLGDLPSGIYFLQMTTGNEVISRKVVKQ